MHKTCVLHSIVLLVLLAPISIASAEEPLFGRLDQDQDGWLVEAEIDYQHRRLFQRLLRTADGDQDGRLTSDEFRAGLEPQQPAKPLVKKQSSELPGADALLLLLARMDTNSDGLISQNEVPTPFADIFKRIEERLGGEPDGVLDRRELTQSAPRLSQIALRITERMDLDVEVELALLSEKQWRSVQSMVSPRSRGDLLADPKRARQFFRQLDRNGDGQITATEVPDQVAERFDLLLERADRDRNEKISESELMAVSRLLQAREAKRLSPDQIQKGIKRLLKKLDRNGDRQISRKEAPRRLAAQFEWADRDGNGRLDRKELAPVVERLSQIRPPDRLLPEKSDSMMLPEK